MKNNDKEVTDLIHLLKTTCEPFDFDCCVEKIKKLDGKLPDDLDELRQQCVDRKVTNLIHLLKSTTNCSIFDGTVERIKKLDGKLPNNLDELRQQCVKNWDK